MIIHYALYYSILFFIRKQIYVSGSRKCYKKKARNILQHICKELVFLNFFIAMYIVNLTAL